MKTLWFRYPDIVFLLSSKFRPRVISMLYSFYLIVYLMYFIFYYNISLFMYCCFFVCGLYIGFSFIIDISLYIIFVVLVIISEIGIIILSLIFPFIWCVVLGSMIISGILFIYYFYDDFLSLIMWYELSLTYDNLFFFFMFWVLGI